MMGERNTNEALVRPLVGLFTQLTDILKSQEAMREVQTVLLIRLAEAVIALQIRLGLVADATELGEAFSMAAAVLRVDQANREKEEEE